MYEGKDVGVTSTLCYGVQWDAVLDFIKDDKHDVTNSTSWGNYVDKGVGLAKTGSNVTYATKNVYDIAGNVWEWSMEATGLIKRTDLGESFYGDGVKYPASGRGGDYPYRCLDNVGFRVALYVK